MLYQLVWLLFLWGIFAYEMFYLRKVEIWYNNEKYGGIPMSFFILNISIHLLCFIASFWALSSLRFERFCDVRKPAKVQCLLLLLSLALGYLVAQFLLALSVYNGL